MKKRRVKVLIGLLLGKCVNSMVEHVVELHLILLQNTTKQKQTTAVINSYCQDLLLKMTKCYSSLLPGEKKITLKSLLSLSVKLSTLGRFQLSAIWVSSHVLVYTMSLILRDDSSM